MSIIKRILFSSMQILKIITKVQLSLVPSNAPGYVIQYKNLLTRNSFQIFIDADSAIELHHELERRLLKKTIKSLDLVFPDVKVGDIETTLYIPCWAYKRLNDKLKDTFSSKYVLSKSSPTKTTLNLG